MPVTGHGHDHADDDDEGGGLSAARLRRPGQTDGPGPLTALEQAALAALLAGDDPARVLFRQQLAGATALSRTYSGVGFITRLAVPPTCPPVPADANVRLRPLAARHPALPGAAEFLLQVRDGRLAVLEAYCYDGAWPTDEAAFQFSG